MRGSALLITGIIIGGVGALNYYVFLSMIKDELVYQIIAYLCYSFYAIGGIFLLLGIVFALKPKK